jgi:tRNA(Ile)-lysidine synthase
MSSRKRGAQSTWPRFIVALSGGLDSTVLLHLAIGFFGAESVLAVHVNHRLQPAAKHFEAFARKLCRTWGVALAVKRLQGQPQRGDSIEAWARNGRYQALSDLANRHGIAHVLTGHHQDDQVETLLMALSRGAGPDGLSGIAQCRPLNREGVWLHRPLLTCSRAELEVYTSQYSLTWIEDPSNETKSFLRNRIRKDLMPTLTAVLPDFARQASRSMALVAEMAHASKSTLIASPRNDHDTHGAALNRQTLLKRNASEQSLELRAWLKSQGLRAPSQAKLAEIRKQLLLSASAVASLQHDGHTLLRYRDQCRVASLVSPSAGSPQPGQVTQPSLFEPALGPTPGGWSLRLNRFSGRLLIRHKRRIIERETPVALEVHPPKSAQKMRLYANGPSRTLKNLFQEAGISALERQHLPCVSLHGEILFVAGLGTTQASPWKFEFLPDL